MDTNQFHNFVDSVIEYLHTCAAQNPTHYTGCRSGDEFELCVVEAANNGVKCQ